MEPETKPALSNRQFVLGIGVLLIAVVCICLALVIQHGSAKASDVMPAAIPAAPACIAGPGEICPTQEMSAELAEYVAARGAVRAKGQELIKTTDMATLRDMTRDLDALNARYSAYADDLQQKITATLKVNPGHRWDPNGLKYVPESPIAASVPPGGLPAKR